MSSSAAVDADASRPRSGILTPSSDGSLRRRQDSISPDGQRRRRPDSAAMDPLLKPSISVKPHPPKTHIQPRVLLPLMLLPREHLALSCLDFSVQDGEWSQSRFVESYVKILDLESRLGAATSILIARNESNGNAYVLERQENGLYVMCKLGSWVDINNLARHATALALDRLRGQKPDSPPTQTVGLALTTPQLNKEQKKKRAAIEAIQSLVRKKAKPLAASGPDVDGTATAQDNEAGSDETSPQLSRPQVKSEVESRPNTACGLHSSTPVHHVAETELAGSSTQQSAESIFHTIRTQYFEALYKSMGSLAYFAKGPLSRARSTFHLDLESNLDMADLIEFLKGLVLTTVQIDKKYRETIPDIISKLSTHIESSDEGDKKKRKTRKTKLGKDCLYPLEDDSVRKWWSANKPDLTDAELSGPSLSQIKSHVSLLRTRETQLQMILILEILALEPLKGADDGGESNLPVLPGSESQQQESSMAPPPKKRNKHNLPVLVDVHADRLTIWQSTASDEQLLLGDSQTIHTQLDGQVAQKSSSEPLKDFCVDVIVPFFSVRLPELCDSINRKLGGPVIISPVKSRSLKRSSSKREQRPGAATKRPAQPNSRRTLQRALSTEQLHRRSVSRGPSNAIALMRSATSTSVGGTKREGSEPLSLKDMPKGDSILGRQRQSSLSRSNSTTSLDDAKASRKAKVEAELKDAISALRKPNREVVGQAMAEAADQRRALAGLSAKKNKKLPRSSLASTIQVKATPANNRFRDVLAAKAETDADIPIDSTEDVIPPSSVGHLVPSTGPRRGHRDAMADSVSPAMDLIGGTPMKPSASSSMNQTNFLRRMANDRPAIPPSSPLTHKKTAALDEISPFNSAANTSAGLRAPSHRPYEVMVTPVKKTASRLDLMESPVSVPVQAAPEPELPRHSRGMSIYEKLGWDDDFDDLL